jgi:hypothetical protein
VVSEVPSKVEGRSRTKEARQSKVTIWALDCFVATLLAMTIIKLRRYSNNAKEPKVESAIDSRSNRPIFMEPMAAVKRNR